MSNPELRVTTRSAAPVREEVTRRLREAIVSGQLKPGERLRERDLVEWTNVSRTSVREALRQLESEGLVDMVPNQGPIVSVLTAEEARDIYEVRGVLEGLAGRRFAVHATDDEIEQLAASVDRMAAIVASGTGETIREEKERFYAILFRGCGNQIAGSVFDLLYARVTRLRSTTLSNPNRPPETIAELRRILEKIRARDPEATEAAFVDHVEKAAAIALEMLDHTEEAAI